MVGVPIEFPNVCECLKFMHSKENINIHTQVIGVAVGKREDIFPTNRKFIAFENILVYFFSK